MVYRKYPEWGTYLKRKREAKYRSAREFCTKVRLGISYPQYSRYEAGDQLPSLEQALEIFRILGIPVLEGILEWSRCQIQDSVSKEEIEKCLERVRLGDSPVASTAKKPSTAEKPAGPGKLSLSLDDVIIFNHTHLEAFKAHPLLRDIFVYVNSYAPEWITPEELANALEVTTSEVNMQAAVLQDMGVVVKKNGVYRASKNFFYFPDDKDFFEVRNLNFLRTAEYLMKKLTPEDLTIKQSFRGVVSRELSSQQMEKVVNRLNDILSEVVEFPENPVMGKIYSVCLLAGEHFSRAQLPGLAKKIELGETPARSVKKGSE
ncbi:helix-turn-helix domain-containing protein [bacterium]|nr:helix-turn-helix domain-containing protein [bacterium]